MFVALKVEEKFCHCMVVELEAVFWEYAAVDNMLMNS